MDLNLIVIEKTIHKSKYFIFGTLINDVINELSRVIIFRERFALRHWSPRVYNL